MSAGDESLWDYGDLTYGRVLIHMMDTMAVDDDVQLLRGDSEAPEQAAGGEGGGSTQILWKLVVLFSAGILLCLVAMLLLLSPPEACGRPVEWSLSLFGTRVWTGVYIPTTGSDACRHNWEL